MRWNEIFHRYQQNTVKKNFTAKIANRTSILRANFNADLMFTGNVIEIRDRWRSGLRSWWQAGGRGSKPCTEVYFLQEFRYIWRTNFFTAKNRKNSPHSTLKDSGASRWNKFFSPLFTAIILHYFLAKARPWNRTGFQVFQLLEDMWQKLTSPSPYSYSCQIRKI